MTAKTFIQSVFSILNHQERVNMCKQILLSLLIGLFDILFLSGLILIINFYTTSNNTSQTYFFSFLSHSNALLVIGVFFILYTVKNWLGYLFTKQQNSFFYEVASRLSKRNIWHYLKSGYMQFVQTDSSVYVRKISQQPIEFSNYILTNLQQIISQSILILFTFIAIGFYHPELYVSIFILLLPPVTMLVYFIKQKLKHVRSNIKLTSQLTIQCLNESLSGYVEGNVYDKSNFLITRYHNQQKQLNENIATIQTLQGLPARLIEVFAVLGFFILIAINKWTANPNGISLLDIGVLMAASYKIIPGLVKIFNSASQIKTYDFTLKDLNIDEETNTEAPFLSQNITSIKFKQVTFKYAEHQLINNLCFEILPGDFVGISSPSGKGKTTLINLLLGFLEQDSGLISINNTLLPANYRKTFWPNISYVKQQPFFVNDTILANIILSDKEYDSNRLNKALAICGLNNMLEQYAEGINKIITENGKNISGGQRQRLMLARALYHDFDLLILDEPFSELDEPSEKSILEKLKSFTAVGKMIILITHNTNSLLACNKTIGLNEN